MGTGHNACYVYGVARIADDAPPAALPDEGIVDRAPVALLRDGDLAAIVSPVPAARFNHDALETALQDDAWMRARILAHHTVLDTLARELTLIAFKFCTVYAHRDDVSDMLSRNRADLRDALSRIDGTNEWGVKLFCDVGRLRALIAKRAPAPVALRTEMQTASAGARFFARKRLQKAVDQHLQGEMDAQAGAIHRRLGAIARDVALGRARRSATNAGGRTMVLNASYLLDRAREPAFRAVFDELRTQCAADGFAFELTGPWPPYSFSSLPAPGSSAPERRDHG